MISQIKKILNSKAPKYFYRLILIFALISLLSATRDYWLYSAFPTKYTVAYGFEKEGGHNGVFFSYHYMIDGKEYHGSVRPNASLVEVKYKGFHANDKYLLAYPSIAKWDGEINRFKKLPDTTRIPQQAWDTIPGWIQDVKPVKRWD